METLALIAGGAKGGRLAVGGIRISGPCLRWRFVRLGLAVCRGIIDLWVVESLGDGGSGWACRLFFFSLRATLVRGR